MARFLFLPYSARGHVNPTLAVVAELAARGEDVRVVAGARFAAEVLAAGAEPVVPDREYEPWSPPSWGPRQLAELARVRLRKRIGLRAAGAAVARELRRFRPDAVVVDAMHPAPRTDAPLIWLSTTYASRRRRGPVLVNALPELEPGHRNPRHRFVGPLLPAPVQRRGGDPLLVVSPGTVFARDAEFFRAVAAEFAGSGWRVLMATGHLAPDRLGPLPPNATATRWIDQRGALARASAFLTHGGMNSVQEALCAGVPMLLAARNREQRRTARRLVELGLGLPAEAPLRPAAERLAADPEVRRGLRRMRRRLHARNGPALAAELIRAEVR